jgi:hypothetical protein
MTSLRASHLENRNEKDEQGDKCRKIDLVKQLSVWMLLVLPKSAVFCAVACWTPQPRGIFSSRQLVAMQLNFPMFYCEGKTNLIYLSLFHNVTPRDVVIIANFPFDTSGFER